MIFYYLLQPCVLIFQPLNRVVHAPHLLASCISLFRSLLLRFKEFALKYSDTIICRHIGLGTAGPEGVH